MSAKISLLALFILLFFIYCLANFRGFELSTKESTTTLRSASNAMAARANRDFNSVPSIEDRSESSDVGNREISNAEFEELFHSDKFGEIAKRFIKPVRESFSADSPLPESFFRDQVIIGWSSSFDSLLLTASERRKVIELLSEVNKRNRELGMLSGSGGITAEEFLASYYDLDAIKDLLASQLSLELATKLVDSHEASRFAKGGASTLALDKLWESQGEAASYPMFSAITEQEPYELTAYLRAGGDANATRPSQPDVTLLELAVLRQAPKHVEVLLAHGSLTTDKTSLGVPLFHVAALNNDLLTVELLLDAGADPEERDVHGNTASMLTRLKGFRSYEQDFDLIYDRLREAELAQ